jgi:hypothetical protein
MSDTPRQEIPVDFEATPWTWGVNRSQPTPWAALMETAPGDTPLASDVERAPLIDAIASCVDRCTPEHRFVLEAHLSEGLGFRPLGLRLGVSKTQAHRIYQAALAECRRYLIEHPKIRERLNLVTYWNQYARQLCTELDDQLQWSRTPGPLVMIETNLAEVRDLVNNHVNNDVWPVAADYEKWAIADRLWQAAIAAATQLARANQWSVDSMTDLLVWKQSKYGHNNILDFGLIGVAIRACDKRARLANMLASDTGDDRDEAIEDTLADIVGYAVIAQMLKDDTFTSELEPI